MSHVHLFIRNFKSLNSAINFSIPHITHGILIFNSQDLLGFINEVVCAVFIGAVLSDF